MRSLALALALLSALPLQKAAIEDSWDAISVTTNYDAKPRWEPVHGSALVKIDGTKVHISVDFEVRPRHVRSLDINGVISSGGRITATVTYTGTDRSPGRLVGIYSTRTEPQTWGDKAKIVTHKEIVFPYPENFEFLGFRTSEAKDR